MRRTTISGLVSRWRILRMCALRSSVVRWSIPKWVYGSLVLAMIAGLLLMMQASYDRLEARGMKAACQNFGSCVAFVFQNADAVRVWPLEMIVRAPDIQ